MEVQSSGYDGNIVSAEIMGCSDGNHLRPQDPLSRYRQLHDQGIDADLRNAPSLWKCIPPTLINVLV